MRILIAILALALAACAHNQPQPTPVAEVRHEVIRVPVPVHCVSLTEVPAMPGTSMPANGDVKQLAAGAAADLTALQDYATRADALLRQCAKP